MQFCVQGSQQQAATWRHRFDDVRPTLLLFLQRLRCIVVNDATTGETSIMVRWDWLQTIVQPLGASCS